MTERNQFSPGVGSGYYGSGEPTGNIVFPQSSIPPTPINLIASNNEYLDKVALTWNAITGSTFYNVYRDFEFLIKISPTVNTDLVVEYDDTTAVPGKVYNYSVSANNNSGESNQSNIDTGSRKINGVQNLSASQTLPTTINVSWDSNPNAVNYKVYRGVTSSFQNMSLIAITSSNFYIDSSNLDYGTTYFYIIVPVSEDGDGQESSHVSGFLFLEKPDCPNFTVTGGTHTNKIVLTWAAVPTATNYRVYRNDVEIKNTTSLNYTDTDIQQGIGYSYKVKSQNQVGLCATTTDTVAQTGWAKLSQPQSLIATDGEAETFITLTWASVLNATHYNIYRRLAAIGTQFTKIDSVQTFSYTDTNTDLIYGSTYVYKVRAAYYINGIEFESFDSNEDTGILKNPIPNAPVLSATNGDFNNKISLSWNAVTHGVSYKIFRNGSQIAITTDTSYDDTDTSLTACTIYNYTVKAQTIFGDESAFSNTDSGYKLLTTPTGLTASDSEFTGKIRVSWNFVPDASDYIVYRSLFNSEASMVELTTTTDPFYDDLNTDLVVGTTYFYAVKARCVCASCSTDDDISPFSNIDSGILKNTPTNFTPPDAPATLTISTPNTTNIILNWSSVTNATGYKIFRDGVQVGTTSTGITTFTETPLQGIQYTYTVKAFNADGDSTSSPSATGFIILLAPTGVVATKNANSTESDIRVTWNLVSGATSYEVHRGIASGSMSLIGTTSTTEYFDTNTDLLYNTIYLYKVRALSALPSATSSFSTMGSSSQGVLKSPQPTSFTVNSISPDFTNKVIITWNTSNYAFGGYSVKRDGNPITNGYSSSNFLRHSNTFIQNASSWSLYNGSSIATSSIRMPTDNTNEDFGMLLTFISNTNNGIYQVIRDVKSSTQYTLSCYVRSLSGTVPFRMSYYDGSTSTFSTTHQATETVQRFTFTFDTTTANITSNIAIGNGPSGATGSIVIWGAQLEKGAVATDLIETTTEPITTNSYTDTTATFGTNHLYTVTALNNIAETTSSNSANGSLKLFAPSLVGITSDSDTEITIIWTPIIGAATYKIYRGTTLDTSTMTLLGSGLTSTEYTDTTATPGVTYYYSVKATTSFATDSDFSLVDFGMRVLRTVQAGDIFNNYFSHNKYSNTNITVTDSNKTNVTFNHFSYETFYEPMGSINWNSLQKYRDGRYKKQIFYSNKLSSTNDEVNYLERIIVHNFSGAANSFSAGNKLYKNFDAYRGEGSNQYEDDITCSFPNYTELLAKTVETIFDPK